MKRPLAPIFLSYCIGIILAYTWPNWITTRSAGLVAAISLPILSAQIILKKRGLILPLLLFASLGAFLFNTSSPKVSTDSHVAHLINNDKVLWIGTVLSYPEFKKFGARIIIKPEQAIVDGITHDVQGKIEVNTRRISRDWYPGVRIVSRFPVREFRNFKNPGSFDYKRYMKEKGFIGRCYIASDRLLAVISSPLSFWRRAVSRIRRNSYQFFMQNIRKPENTIYVALLLGMKRVIPDYVRNAFNEAGVSHILAISGLHLGLLCGILFFLFSHTLGHSERVLLRYGKSQASFLLTVPFILCYAELTGMSVPTMRATLMILLTFLAIVVRRSRDIWSILILAAMIILVLQPQALFSVSFQLSFVALLAILYIAYELEKYLPGTRPGFFWKYLQKSTRAFFVSLAATVGVAPLLAYHFHAVSLIGILANIIVIPLIGFIALPAGILALTLAPVFPTVAETIAWPGTVAIHLALKTALALSSFQWGYFHTPHMNVLNVILLYILILVPFLRVTSKLKYSALITAIALLSFITIKERLITPPIERGTIKATALDAGGATAVLFEFPDGWNMLVDGGNVSWSTFDVGKHVVVPFLWNRHIKKIDSLVLASPAPRNVILNSLLKSFRAEEFWCSGIGLRGRSFREDFELLHRMSAKKRFIDEPGEIRIGEAKCKIIQPTIHDVHWRKNSQDTGGLSVSMLITFRQAAFFLLPAYVPSAKLTDKLTKIALSKPKVLILYGKEMDSWENTVSLIKPQIVIFTPRAPRLTRSPVLKHSGKARKPANGDDSLRPSFYSPSINGAITVETDGATIRVTTFSNRHYFARDRQK